MTDYSYFLRIGLFMRQAALYLGVMASKASIRRRGSLRLLDVLPSQRSDRFHIIPRAFLCLAALAVLLAVVPAKAQQLIEGFEDPAMVHVSGGKLSSVSGGDGVTQGAKAAELPAKASIQVELSGNDCRKFGWLLCDSLTVQPMYQLLTIRFDGAKVRASHAVCLQAGKDVLAVPLPWVVGSDSTAWTDEKITFTLTNSGESPVILDNIRFEDAAKPPANCTLADYGPDSQPLWPGFEGGKTIDSHLAWSGANPVFAENGPFIDPLGCDYIGAPWWGKMPDSFELTTSGNEASVAWIWVTHYRWGPFEPLEYGLKQGSKTLLYRKLSQKQAFGSEGLFEGVDGAWTPQWFDATYAPRLCEVVQVSLAGGKNRFDVTNCQVAAVAMGPSNSKAALEKYVEQVHKDITRFRRQFVLGYRLDSLCRLQPTDVEDKAGLMAFAPPVDQALLATYSPQEADRATAWKGKAFNGGVAVIPVAIAPVKKAGSFAAALTIPRGADNKPIGLPAGTEFHFLQKVPRLIDGHVEFQPWLMDRKYGPSAAKEIVQGAIIVRVSPTAAEGTYKGSLKISAGSSQVDLPIEIEVTNLGADAGQNGTFGLLSQANIEDFYRNNVEFFSDPQREALTGKIRQQLLGLGLDMFTLPGVVYASDSIRDDTLVRQLRTFQGNLTNGPMFFDLNGYLRSLEASGIRSGTQQFQPALKAMAGRLNDLAGRAKLHGYYAYLDWARRPEDLASMSRDAEAFPQEVRACLSTYGHFLAALTQEGLKRQLTPFKAICVEANTHGIATQIESFKSIGPGREFFLNSYCADRYGCGFFAAASGADGCMIQTVSAGYPTYSGWETNNAGFLAPQADGTFLPTFACLQLWQAKDDYELVARCRALLAKAKAAKVDAASLDKLLQDIRNTANTGIATDYSAQLLRTASHPPSSLNKWREELMKQGSDLAKAMKKP